MNQPEATRVVLYGAAGRMGQALVRTAQTLPDIAIAAALVRADSEWVGRELKTVFGDGAPDLNFTCVLDPNAQPDVVIEFSNVAAFDSALKLALDRNLPLVSGTTGLSIEQYSAIENAARSIPVLWSSNFSLGIAMLTAVAQQVAQALPDWDCEIIETHHRDKQDAPSGTALTLGRALAQARQVDFGDQASYGRKGNTGVRRSGEIGIHAVRGGDIIGEHTLLFTGEGERIEMVHRAHNRDIFARGALQAGKWLSRKKSGLYKMQDIFSVKR